MSLRQALHSGGAVVGTWLQTASPVVAELLAAVGFDFIAVDAEHSAVDVPQALALFQAIRAGNPACAPLVRVPGHDYATVKRYMDAGAAGVIAPLINTPAQAAEVVSAVKYPPDGRRGVGFARSNAYGMDLDGAVIADNAHTVVCVQIEHADGAAAAAAIVATPGVDAVFIGPYDLSASLGVMGQFDHPLMVTARRRILAAAAAAGVAAGIHVIRPDPEEVLSRAAEGYRLIAYSLDTTMLLHTARAGLAAIRAAAAERARP